MHLFNFTINPDNVALEPGVDTSLTERLGQLTYLVQTFGAHAVSPRFDPIVHYRSLLGGQVMDNTRDFEVVVRHVGTLGIDHIVFSFCQDLGAAVGSDVAGFRMSRHAFWECFLMILVYFGVFSRWNRREAYPKSLRNMRAAGMERLGV